MLGGFVMAAATCQQNREKLLRLRRVMVARWLKAHGTEKDWVSGGIAAADRALGPGGFADELDIKEAEDVAFGSWNPRDTYANFILRKLEAGDYRKVKLGGEK